jgi:hypothetical protein
VNCAEYSRALGKKVLLIIKCRGIYGRNIVDSSVKPEEEEVLFMDNAKFRRIDPETVPEAVWEKLAAERKRLFNAIL